MKASIYLFEIFKSCTYPIVVVVIVDMEPDVGTSIVWEALRSLLSVDISANLAKSVSWSASLADFLDSNNLTSSNLFLTSPETPFWKIKWQKLKPINN